VGLFVGGCFLWFLCVGVCCCGVVGGVGCGVVGGGGGGEKESTCALKR